MTGVIGKVRGSFAPTETEGNVSAKNR